MAEAETLTLAFVSSHPVAAARVLEGLSGVDAAALFARLPARAAAPALAAMLPTAAARIVASLEDLPALGLLTAAGVQGAVAVLRHVAEPRRTRLIEGLSTATAVASRMLLGYPEDAVGAWADPETIALPPGTSAAEALARVRSDTDVEAAAVFVVADDQRLLGMVDLHVLLRAPETTSLASLMRPPAGTLPAFTPLAGASHHPGWRQASALPVVERGNRLIGVLDSAKLAQARARGAPRPASGKDTVAGLAARSYWDTVSGLVRAGLAVLPPAGPVMPEEK
ncbi:MAG: magnesium transporter [Betaproteobacteria bacterium]|nr:magnesium transporter [Betaproteobacteria bacterium]